MRPLAALMPLLLLPVIACRGSAPPPAAAPARGPRVLLLSIDGAGAQTLHELWREGKLDGGGFARFFDHGEVAEALLPVDPTVTSTNHITMASGFGPAQTGIVGNRFHLTGTPWGRFASGFEAPIATETLWEAARRQGKRVASLAWPGTDGTTPRRSADWGFGWPFRPYPASFAADLAARGLAASPGPADDAALERWLRGQPAGIDVDAWCAQTERFLRFLVDVQRASLARNDWDLMLAYLPVIDETGHRLLLTEPRQWGYSPQRRDAFAAGRLRVWRAVDRELARLLAGVDLDHTVVVVVSDHGMLPVHTLLDVNVLLSELGLLAHDAMGAIDPVHTRAFAAADCAIAHVYVAPGAERASLLEQLARTFRDWRAGGVPVLERVLTRADLPALGLDAPDAGDLVLFTAAGYTFDFNPTDLREQPYRLYGMHGFLLASHPEMQAVYLAVGPGIAHGRVGPLPNTAVATRVARWLGIEPPRAQPSG